MNWFDFGLVDWKFQILIRLNFFDCRCLSWFNRWIFLLYVPIKTRYLHTNEVTLALCLSDGDWISTFQFFISWITIAYWSDASLTNLPLFSYVFPSLQAPLEIYPTVHTHHSYYRNRRWLARMILFYRTTVTMAPVSFDWCSLSSQQHRDTNQVSSCQEFNEGRGCSTGVGVSPDLAKKSDCKNFELVSRHDRLMPWFLCFSFLPNLLIHMFR